MMNYQPEIIHSSDQLNSGEVIDLSFHKMKCGSFNIDGTIKKNKEKEKPPHSLVINFKKIPLIAVKDEKPITPHEDRSYHIMEKLHEGIVEKDGNFVIYTNKLMTNVGGIPYSDSNCESRENGICSCHLSTFQKLKKISLLSTRSKKKITSNLPENSNTNLMQSSNFSKYDIGALKYKIYKEYSKIKIPEPNTHKFLNRMKFSEFKKQSCEEKINEIVECSKPKMEENEKVDAFNRLIEDSNRRAEAKQRVEINLNQKEEVTPIQKMFGPQCGVKMTQARWEKIYKERFHEKMKARNRNIELEKERSQAIRAEQEEKIIREIEMRRRVASPDEIEKISQRLYNESQMRRIKSEMNCTQSQSLHSELSERVGKAPKSLIRQSSQGSKNTRVSTKKYADISSRYMNTQPKPMPPLKKIEPPTKNNNKKTLFSSNLSLKTNVDLYPHEFNHPPESEPPQIKINDIQNIISQKFRNNRNLKNDNRLQKYSSARNNPKFVPDYQKDQLIFEFLGEQI